MHVFSFHVIAYCSDCETGVITANQIITISRISLSEQTYSKPESLKIGDAMFSEAGGNCVTFPRDLKQVKQFGRNGNDFHHHLDLGAKMKL